MATEKNGRSPRAKIAKSNEIDERAAQARPLSLDLALQGGASHGAFTWGVLDRLLEEEDLTINGISGTSSGAINGAMLVCGLTLGGRRGAQQLLREFWESLARIGALYTPFQPAIESFEKFEETWGFGRFNPFGMFRPALSPAQMNPFRLNPLRDLLARLLDVDAIQSSKAMCLFVTATNVHTGQPRVFHCHEVTVDALMASACLPFVFEAVQIDGVPYWDGGYVGNPVIWPLIYHTDANDVLLVQINPLVRETTPTRFPDIVNRLNEITFNASLIAEMRAIHFVIKLMRENKLDTNRYKHVRMHAINLQDVVRDIDASTKDNTDIDFLEMLHSKGREAADQWLAKHKGDVGVRETIDIEKIFLTPHHTKKSLDKDVDALAAPKLPGAS